MELKLYTSCNTFQAFCLFTWDNWFLFHINLILTLYGLINYIVYFTLFNTNVEGRELNFAINIMDKPNKTKIATYRISQKTEVTEVKHAGPSNNWFLFHINFISHIVRTYQLHCIFYII